MTYYDLTGFNNQNYDLYQIIEKLENSPSQSTPSQPEKLSLGQLCQENSECETGLCTRYYGSGWHIFQDGKVVQESPDTKRCAEICGDNQIISNCYGTEGKCLELYPGSIPNQFKCVGRSACNNGGYPTCWDNNCMNCECDDPKLTGPVGEFTCKKFNPPTTTTIPKLNTKQNNFNIKPFNSNIDIDKLNQPIDLNLNIEYNQWGKAPSNSKNRKIINANLSPNNQNNLPQNSIFDRMTQLASIMMNSK